LKLSPVFKTEIFFSGIETVGLGLKTGNICNQNIVPWVSLCSLGELDAHFLSAGEFGVGLRLQVF
jgi:hypothetical protein